MHSKHSFCTLTYVLYLCLLKEIIVNTCIFNYLQLSIMYAVMICNKNKHNYAFKSVESFLNAT